MGENDRVAIHEAMEQQTVTIAKAGMHASLNARCSVLAAANPVYGQYDRKKRMQENIGLPDSLLSRFDLLFVVLDNLNSETDRKIASHVIRGHQYRPQVGKTGHDSDEDTDDEDDDESVGEDKKYSIWQRSHHENYTLTKANGENTDENDESTGLLKHDFLRKFLNFAKLRIAPKLTDSAREEIACRYTEMRSRQDERTLPITARSLETVIRLATAHAKARLSDTVEPVPDVANAMELLGFALYHEKTGGAPVAPIAKDTPSENNGAAPVSPEKEKNPVEGQQQPKRPKLNEVPLQNRIRDRLEEDDDGVPLDEICPDVTDRKQVSAVVEELAAKNLLQVEDGVAYWTG